MSASSASRAARGRFISLEGGEGVGKSTLAKALKEALGARGVDVVLTREPGGTPGAELLRQALLHPPAGVGGWDPLTEALIFYAARGDHLDKLIRPTLARGGWVISDRFSDSTRAYQAAAGGLSSDQVESLDRMCVRDTAPDLTLILDLPLSLSRERRSDRAAEDAIESRGADYHARVRQAFLDIAARDPVRCVVIDASQSADAVVREALAAIASRLGVG